MWEIGDRVIVVETPEEKNIWRLNISAGDKGTVMAKRDGQYLTNLIRILVGMMELLKNH